MNKKYRVLITDDIFLNRMLLSEIIEELGHVHFDASNGREAIQILEKEFIDLVLMDIEMPVMNGFEATRHIRHYMSYPKSETIVVAITAHNPETFFEEYQNRGFDGLISKPYSVDKIQNVLDNLAERINKKFDW